MVTETGRPTFKRRQYLVAKGFQLKYVGVILIFMFLTAVLCSYVVYYTSMLLMGEKLARVYPQGRLVHIVNIVNFRILLSLILVSPLVALIGILLSHRIAGPIFRMEAFLNSMASGDFTSTLVLRKDDELTSVANGINNLSDNLRSAIGGQKILLDKVRSAMDDLKNKPQDAGAINKLAKEIDELSKELTRYKT